MGGGSFTFLLTGLSKREDSIILLHMASGVLVTSGQVLVGACIARALGSWMVMVHIKQF